MNEIKIDEIKEKKKSIRPVAPVRKTRQLVNLEDDWEEIAMLIFIALWQVIIFLFCYMY